MHSFARRSNRRATQQGQLVGREGFTLIEISIALGMLAFGILAVAAAQLSSLDIARRSRSLTHAMYLAGEQLELFHGMSAASVQALITANPNDPLNPIDPDPGDEDSTTYLRVRSFQPDTPEAGVMTIRIQVRWTDELGVNRDYMLDGIKADQ